MKAKLDASMEMQLMDYHQKEIEIPLKTVKANALNSSIMDAFIIVECDGTELTVFPLSIVITAPTTLEEVVYLDNFRKKILKHEKILLANVDAAVYMSGRIGVQYGYFQFEDERLEDLNMLYRAPWHYMVSEIVKDEGVPYFEIICSPNENNETNEYIFTLVYFENGNQHVLYTSEYLGRVLVESDDYMLGKKTVEL